MSNSSISASALFHFTSSIEDLLDILKNEFCPKYSAEDIPTLDAEGERPHYYSPMVCFCDIPLSRIAEHSSFYGEYAIGLSKEWGKTKGLNPVFYHLPESFPTKASRRIMDNLVKVNPGLIPLTGTLGEIGKGFFDLSLYTKRYEGRPWRNGKRLSKKRTFYDEREWRYVPLLEIAEKLKVPLVFRTSDYNRELVSSYEKDLANNARLTFEPSDIKYLIVPDEKDILPMVDGLEKIKAKYPAKIVKVLTTRIITMEQINTDF